MAQVNGLFDLPLHASGIFNLGRNIVGSEFPLVPTLLARRVDVHQNEIVKHVAKTQQWFQQQIATLTGFLGPDINPADATCGSQSTLYQELEQQALLWASSTLSLVWLFRRVSHVAGLWHINMALVANSPFEFTAFACQQTAVDGRVTAWATFAPAWRAAGVACAFG